MANRLSNKTWIILILGVVIIAVGAIVGITLSRSPASPPDFTLPVITWNKTILSTLRGTPVVLNFWSISCYWCRQQLPYLEAVALRSGTDMKVIAINMANDVPAIQKFFGEYEPAMTIAVDENREAFVEYCLAYNNTAAAIPFTLFLDSEGTVQYVRIGAFASEQALRTSLNDFLGITIP